MAPFALRQYPALKLAGFYATGILLCPSHVEVWEIALVSGFLLTTYLITGQLAKRFPAITIPLSCIPHILWVVLGCLGKSVDSLEVTKLPPSLNGQEVTVGGMITEAPRKQGERLRFVLESEFVRSESTFFPLHSNFLVTMKHSAVPPEYGSTAVVEGILLEPRPARNPGEFDQRQFYSANDVAWMLLVERDDVLTVLNREGGWWIMRVFVVPARRAIISEIDQWIGGQEGEFLKGVLLGERGGLSPEAREAFTAAGVAHILAVSGGNVAVVVAFVFFATEILRLQRKARPLAAGCGVLFYMLLVGNQAPVVRATIMALTLLVGTALQKRSNPTNALGLSALLILGMDSRQLFDVGFQLSFLAVLSIIQLYPITNRWISRVIPGNGTGTRVVRWIAQLGGVSLVATLGTLPLTAGYFGRVSLIGVIANIIVVPASGLSLLLGFVAVLFAIAHGWIAGIYHGLNELLLQLTLQIALWAGSLSYASIDSYAFRWVDTLPLYAVLIFLFSWERRSLRTRMLIVVVLAFNIWIFFPVDRAFESGKALRVTFLDVGQGDAVLVEFPGGETLLVDAGPASGSLDTGAKTVVPYLKRKGIIRMDMLVATHPHTDHIGGIPAVLKDCDVIHVIDPGRVVESSVSQRFEEAVNSERCQRSHAKAGIMFEKLQSARIYVLGPDEFSSRAGNINNSSVVFKLVYGSVSFLFTGDAEKESEERMVRRYGDFLKSTVLKTGHHGSRTSSSGTFLDFVNPEIAVVSVGTRNRYRHPSDETMQELASRDVVTYRTDREGAIILETDGRSVEKVVWSDGE